jgi:hypothetical protein
MAAVFDDQVRANCDGGEDVDEVEDDEETEQPPLLSESPKLWEFLHSLLHLKHGATLCVGPGCVSECADARCRKGLASAYEGDVERRKELRFELFEVDERDSGRGDNEAIDGDFRMEER